MPIYLCMIMYVTSSTNRLSSSSFNTTGLNHNSGLPSSDRVKSLLQLIAASAAGRDIVYFTFGDTSLQEELDHLIKLLREREVPIYIATTQL